MGDLAQDEAAEMLVSVREMAIQLKRALFEKELMYIYNEMKANHRQAAG